MIPRVCVPIAEAYGLLGLGRMGHVNRTSLHRTLGSLFLAGVLLGTGCTKVVAPPGSGGEVDGGEAVTDKSYVAQTPTLTNVAPSNVTLGQTVTVFGTNFIPKDSGTLSLYVKGAYTDTDGTETRIDGMTIPLTVTPGGTGQATFVFGPNVLFSPTGDTLGTFQGNFQVVSTLTINAANGQAGDQWPSDAQASTMTVGPSLLVTELRAVGSGINCSPVTTGTVSGADLSFGVRVLGMTPGTSDAPITFSYSFDTTGMNVGYVANTDQNVWPPSPGVAVTAPDGTYTFSFPVETDSAIVNPLEQEQVINISPPVQINQASLSTVKLAKFASGTLMTNENDSTLNITVQATSADGSTTLSRTVALPYYQQVAVDPWDGIETVKQIFPMDQASCSSGGLTGQMYSYSEGSSESRTRSINLTANSSSTIGTSGSINLGPSFAQINASLNASSTQTFGLDVNQAVTTESHVSYTTTINVLPGYVGASFRQPIQTQRVAQVSVHNACGQTQAVGSAVMTNWKWNFDINQGQSCSTVQPSAQALQPATFN